MRSVALPLLAGLAWHAFAEPSAAVSAPESGNDMPTEAAEQALSAADGVATAVAQKMGMSRELKLGFVNFRRIMLEIPQLTDMRRTLESEFRAENSRLQSEQEALANLEAQLAKMERNDAYIAFEKQVIAKRRDVARQEAALRDGYSVRRNEEMAKLQSVVADEIVALAKEEGYDIILNDIGVVYVSEGADLTSAIIKRLQLRTP
ncbi:MAG: OmpH family outer membrane protein [Cardiobacteriaceae bacterium]|nr:OmpH family outer membrane protein [Cardiobacteriaceae bacterium]